MVEDPSLVEYICRTPHEKLKKAFYARQKGFLARSMMSHGLVARSAAFARLHVPCMPCAFSSLLLVGQSICVHVAGNVGKPDCGRWVHGLNTQAPWQLSYYLSRCSPCQDPETDQRLLEGPGVRHVQHQPPWVQPWSIVKMAPQGNRRAIQTP